MTSPKGLRTVGRTKVLVNWMGRLAGFLIAVLLLAAPVQAAPNDLSELVRLLVDQFHQSGIPQKQKSSPCWLEAEAIIRDFAFTSLMSDPELGKVDLGPSLEQIQKAVVAEGFAFEKPFQVAHAYALGRKKPARFIKQLAKLPGPKLNWKEPQVRERAKALHARLQKLERKNLQAQYRGRYSQATWTMSVAVTYSPLRSTVRIYLLGSSKCPLGRRTKTVTLSLQGTVAANEKGYLLSDPQTKFSCRGCSSELVGKWNDRLRPERGGNVLAAHRLRLRVSGSAVSGALIQDILYTDVTGASQKSRVKYKVKGRVDAKGRLEAEIHSESIDGRLGWLTFRPNSINGLLKGKIQQNKARGQLYIKGFPSRAGWTAELSE